MSRVCRHLRLVHRYRYPFTEGARPRALLRKITQQTMHHARAGSHTERGRMTLRRLVELSAEHAEAHARQLQALREEYKKAKGKK